jgi:hypothetical protein
MLRIYDGGEGLMIKLRFFAIVFIVFSPWSSAAGWSEWLGVERVDLHPTWGVRVLFSDVVDSTCGSKTAQWSAANDPVFMDRITSTLLSAKFADGKIRLWVSGCKDGIAQVNQTQIQ